MADQLANEVPDFTWKIILVGNKKVGKTSITNRYVNNKFSEEYKSSQDVQFQRKNQPIEGTDKWAQLHIWDTLGQEKFKALAPVFFRRSVGCFLVYDVTNRDSFNALQGWIDQINASSEDKIIVMLLGNKSDLPDKAVTSDEGLEFAKQNGYGFMEVSAKGDINISAAFKSLITNVYAAVNKKHLIENPQALKLEANSAAADKNKKKKDDGCCK